MKLWNVTTYALFALSFGITASAADAKDVLLLVNPTFQNNPGYQGEVLLSSTPAANAVLQQPPDAVTLTFSKPVRAEGSYIKIYDLYGTQITSDEIAISANSMSISLPSGLSSGKYRVKWQARCMCDSPDINDNFHYTVQ